MYSNCMPDVMILAQAVLQIFCSQSCFTIQNAKVIQSNIYRILPKVKRVIYTLDTMWAKYYNPSSSSPPDILFTRFHRFTMQKSKKEHNSAMTSLTEKKTRGPLVLYRSPDSWGCVKISGYWGKKFKNIECKWFGPRSMTDLDLWYS